MSGRHGVRFVATMAAGMAGTACADDIPSDPASEIRGLIRYVGSAERAMQRPSVTVALFPTFPPQAVPFASVSIRDPGLDAEGTPYALLHVDPRSGYFLVAALRDLDQPALDPPAVGGYPNFCGLLGAVGPLNTARGERLEGIDVELFEGSGTADPCLRPPAPDDAGVSGDAAVADGGS